MLNKAELTQERMKKIYEEACQNCLRDNCQSYSVMALTAMEKALKEYRDNITEALGYHY